MNKKRKSLKWKLISIMLWYWVLPFLIIIGTIGVYMMTSQEQNQLSRLNSQVEMNTKTSVERLSRAVADSRQATYDQMLHERYRSYVRGMISGQMFASSTQMYLESQYSHKKTNSIAVLMLERNPENMRYASYNYSTGGGYDMLRKFYDSDQKAVLEKAAVLGTAVGFVKCEDRFYIVRNLVDRNFETWGILANRINMEYCFEPLYSFPDFDVQVELDGEKIIRTGDKKAWEYMPEEQFTEQRGDFYHKGRAFIYNKMKSSDFELLMILNVPKKDILTPLYGYVYVVLVMLLLLIPILFLVLRMSGKYLSGPVEQLMDSAREIEKGNLGYQWDGDMGSREFNYLRESFNSMSEQLKYQFDHIYEEELALRDAKIMALQSQINPHFMNNTLEIINWEARLSGNEKVSKMIGALSTLMDAAMDRRKMPEVRLAEEMVYVNAYLYITSERLGKRLTVKKELPDEIMDLKVPRLIMQPIIENAIEHGVVPGGSGYVLIRGRRDGKYLYLEVINSGDFTPEAEARVARLLSPDYDTSRESSGNLGIANVNQRLKILYGETCGLSIHKCGEQETVSILTILASN